MFMGGFLSWVFVNKFKSHPPYPQKDPRLLEAMGIHHLEGNFRRWPQPREAGHES